MFSSSTCFKIGADKGFQYSNVCGSYICQRKNHFQLSIQILVDKIAKYVYTEGHYHEIGYYTIEIYAIRNEFRTEKVQICQSNTDRRHVKYEPVIQRFEPTDDNRVVIKRLHFSEITKNNKFSNQKPNSMQRYFILIVELRVHLTNGKKCVLYSVESERIIVRVSFFFTYKKKSYLMLLHVFV